MTQKLLDGSIQLRQLHAIVSKEDRLKRFIEIYKVYNCTRIIPRSGNGQNSSVSLPLVGNIIAIFSSEKEDNHIGLATVPFATVKLSTIHV